MATTINSYILLFSNVFCSLIELKSVVELSNVQIILSSNSIAGTASFFFIGLFQVSICFTDVHLTQMNTGKRCNDHMDALQPF